MIPSNAPEKDFLDDDTPDGSPSANSAPDHAAGKPIPPRAVQWSYTAGFNNSYRLSTWHLEGRTHRRTLCGQKIGSMADHRPIEDIPSKLCRRCAAAMTGRRDLNHRYSPVI